MPCLHLFQFVPGDADAEGYEGYEEEYQIVGTQGGGDDSGDGAMDIMLRQDFVLDNSLYSEFNT